MSVIRLRSSNKDELVDAATFVLDRWKEYSDPSVDVIAYSNDEPHHTITLIARYTDGLFELDLVLRDNHTGELYPDGVSHPHKDVQHIKKENIGLIEVMGLAILPPHLKDELAQVESFLLDSTAPVAEYHRSWALSIAQKYECAPDNVSHIVQEELGKVFVQVLEHAGIFKDVDAFTGFISYLGGK